MSVWKFVGHVSVKQHGSRRTGPLLAVIELPPTWLLLFFASISTYLGLFSASLTTK
jgi:hypothetical protein